jgi:hypothetical protein
VAQVLVVATVIMLAAYLFGNQVGDISTAREIDVVLPLCGSSASPGGRPGPGGMTWPGACPCWRSPAGS